MMKLIYRLFLIGDLRWRSQKNPLKNPLTNPQKNSQQDTSKIFWRGLNSERLTQMLAVATKKFLIYCIGFACYRLAVSYNQLECRLFCVFLHTPLVSKISSKSNKFYTFHWIKCSFFSVKLWICFVQSMLPSNFKYFSYLSSVLTNDDVIYWY